MRAHGITSGVRVPLADSCGRKSVKKYMVKAKAQMTENASGSAVWIREHLKKLSAYTPIEPFEIISAKLGRKPENIVKLDANENPYGPPPEVMAALGSMKFPNIYPDPESRTLREALAKWCNVPKEHILV